MRLSTVRLHQLLVVATILVPGAVLVAFALANRAETLQDRTQAVVRTEIVMREHARKVFDTVELVLDRADDYAYARSWRQIGAPQTSRFLASLKAPLEDAMAIWIADADGVLRAASVPFEPGASVAGRDFFTVHRERQAGIFVSALYDGTASGRPTFAVSRRRSTADGRFDGTIHVALDPDSFARFYARAATPMAHAAALMRADGTMLVQEPAPEPGPERGREPEGGRGPGGGAADPALPTQVLRAAARMPGGGIAWTEPGAPSRLVAFQRVGDYPLYVVFAVERAVLLAPWYGRLAAYGTATLVAALTLGFVAWLALGRARAEARALALLEEESAQRRDAEAVLRQAHKMDAVGQLTGGIAHDFNNHLAVITGSLELVQRRLARGDRSLDHARDPGGGRQPAQERDVSRLIEGAIEGAMRAAKLTHRLLVFARRQTPEPAAVDPNQLVLGLVDLLRRTLGEHVVVETRLAAAPPAMRVDENQLENAILNLAVNARDAMPEGGRLVLETRGDGRRLESGPSVVVTLRDTGSGMPPEVVARAFEPFFTTKAAGRGTGLGLAQVAGFIRQSGGDVEIESVPGEGTAVHLMLPVALAAFAPAPAVAEDARDAIRGRGETILVVEDDGGVRAASVEALRELGYRVLDAEGAGDAMALVEAHPDVALLLTDMVMPAQDGASLAERVRQRRPGLPVLFATGYGGEAESATARVPDSQILRKPARLAALAAKVDAMLRARDSAAA